MIDHRDITVVAQGAIDEVLTPVSLHSIRQVLPGATIILSTWEGSEVDGLDYDVLVESQDPGAGFCDSAHHIRNNVNRQIVSSRNGLKAARTPYALKTRCDIQLVSDGFLRYFEKHGALKPGNNAIVDNRIVINNLYCSDPRISRFCFHVSDWVQFGLTRDVLNMWDIALQPLEDNDYFSTRPRPAHDPIPSWTFKYIPEQYIWSMFLKKNGMRLNFDHFADDRDIEKSEASFANNLIIVDYEDFGIRFLKFNPYKWDYDGQFDHLKWAHLSQKVLGDRISIPAAYIARKSMRTTRLIAVRGKIKSNVTDIFKSLRGILRIAARPVSILRYSTELGVKAGINLYRIYTDVRALRRGKD